MLEKRNHRAMEDLMIAFYDKIKDTQKNDQIIRMYIDTYLQARKLPHTQGRLTYIEPDQEIDRVCDKLLNHGGKLNFSHTGTRTTSFDLTYSSHRSIVVHDLESFEEEYIEMVCPDPEALVTWFLKNKDHFISGRVYYTPNAKIVSRQGIVDIRGPEFYRDVTIISSEERPL